jgi:hypothetical protein
MTICAWISTTGGTTETIASKWDPNNNAGWAFLVLPNGVLDMFVEANNDIMKSASSVTPGQWTFVSLVWHNVPHNYTAEFYFNGIMDTNHTSGSPTQGSSGSAHLEVGGLYQQDNARFQGSMRDVAIYNRALSASEILTNFFNSELSTNVPYPDLLYYKMSEYGEANITPPLYLNNSATSGSASKGTVWNTNDHNLALPDWVNNPGGYPSAIHLHGTNVTQISTDNSTDFNFTANPFTINVWLGAYGNGYYIMGNNNSANNGWCLSENSESTKIRFGGETNGDYAIVTKGSVGNWNR